jgi:RNA polymerase sigma factor (sigma-70 family)
VPVTGDNGDGDRVDDPADPVAVLVRRLAAGETSPSVARCMDRVVRRAEPIARATCRAHAAGLGPARIDELVQDTLEIVVAKLHTYVPAAPFDRWVRGIAVNACRNARRKKRDLLGEDGVLDPADPSRDALRGLERRQRHAVLVGAIEATLDGVEQDVLFHRYVHGLSRAQIAEVMELRDADMVRNVLVRARRRLRDAIVARLAELGHSSSLLRSEGG